MRAAVFRGLLAQWERRPSALFRVMQLQILCNLTARAFDVPGRRIWYLPYPQALGEYGAFTVQCMTRHRPSPERLYREAHAVGRRIRRITGLRDRADLERLVIFLYRNLQIDMSGSITGEITVSSCYFSKIYTPQQCQWMSNVDAGIIAGLCGGGRLTFTGRLTEGCGACRACFTGGEEHGA